MLTLLENICSGMLLMVVLCGQTLLQGTLLLFHWKSFAITDQSTKTVKQFAIYGMYMIAMAKGS